ncbi:MAG TPA: arylesterase [Burkholderiaceae bacterium]|nr:arylesterase [Burkholderiaceae bacterium]
MASMAGEKMEDSGMQNVSRKFRRLARALHAIVFIAFVLCTLSAYSASKTVTMLVMGDSLSAEYGLPRGSGWISLLEQRMRQEKIDTVIINASISGETTSGGRGRISSLLEKHHPDITIIELGANDALRGLSLTATEANLHKMIDEAQDAKSKVLLVGMQIPPNYGSDYARKFLEIYPKLAKKTKSSLVPFFFDGLIGKTDMFQPDRIHPTVEAQPVMLDTVWRYLQPLLKK